MTQNKAIGINGNEANVIHRVGSGQYAFELLKHLSRLDSSNRFEVYLETKPAPDFPKETDNWRYKILGPQGLWVPTKLQAKLLSEKLKGEAPSVFFTPGHYTPFLMPTKSVISIMDMSFERFPEYFKKKDYYQLKYWTSTSAKIAQKILTISNFSKSEICKIYNFPSEKVVVTYCGYDKDRFNEAVKDKKASIKSVLGKYKINQPYLLFLGTLQPRKNLPRLIEAFGQLKDSRHQLVVVGMINEGRGGWMNESIFETVKRLGLENRVIFTGYVPDSEAPLLLSGSDAYILPSLYEGFGIPPIEAMATGVPVVVSKISSLPEICGQAAIYIEDPYSVKSLTSALQKVLNLSDSERKNRIRTGISFVKRYNWGNTAKETLAVLENV